MEEFDRKIETMEENYDHLNSVIARVGRRCRPRDQAQGARKHPQAAAADEVEPDFGTIINRLLVGVVAHDLDVQCRLLFFALQDLSEMSAAETTRKRLVWLIVLGEAVYVKPVRDKNKHCLFRILLSMEENVSQLSQILEHALFTLTLRLRKVCNQQVWFRVIE